MRHWPVDHFYCSSDSPQSALCSHLALAPDSLHPTLHIPSRTQSDFDTLRPPHFRDERLVQNSTCTQYSCARDLLMLILESVVCVVVCWCVLEDKTRGGAYATTLPQTICAVDLLGWCMSTCMYRGCIGRTDRWCQPALVHMHVFPHSVRETQGAFTRNTQTLPQESTTACAPARTVRPLADAPMNPSPLSQRSSFRPTKRRKTRTSDASACCAKRSMRESVGDESRLRWACCKSCCGKARTPVTKPSWRTRRFSAHAQWARCPSRICSCVTARS